VVPGQLYVDKYSFDSRLQVDGSHFPNEVKKGAVIPENRNIVSV